MEVNKRVIRRNSWLIYTTLISLGIVLSALVYNSTVRVKKNTLFLVESELPTYSQLQTLNTNFIELELYLNEYYANQNRAIYTNEFQQTSNAIGQSINQIGVYLSTNASLAKLSTAHERIVNLADVFDQNMKQTLSEIDWDLARAHLDTLSQLRKQTKPLIEAAITDLDHQVQKRQELTKLYLNETYYIVIAYGLAILFIAFIIGKYIKVYIKISAKNRKLALFPERNPNMVISLNHQNEVTYRNPATTKFLNKVKLTEDLFFRILNKQIITTQEKIIAANDNNASFEIKIKSKTLSCELHHLADMEHWDLHITDITERKHAEQQLKYQAFHNPISGLFNKNKLLDELTELFISQTPFAIGIIEARQFTQLISRIGPEKASKVSAELANKINKVLSIYMEDSPYCLYHTSEHELTFLIKTRLSDNHIAELTDYLERSIECETFSYGVHLELDFGFARAPEHATNVNTLISALNAAIETAKYHEHSSLVIYQQALGRAIEHENKLQDNLRHALTQKVFELHYQPQLSLEDNHIIGLETLIRWPTEDGFISPAEFIPIAERSGLIIPMGVWILEQACQQAVNLIEQGHSDIVVAVNISPQQFKHPAFLDTVIGTLALTQVPPQNIELEITEGVIMYNEHDTIHLLNELREFGLKLSIDDFGTGYSSLSYLKQFPVDKLKIDQSFVRHLGKNKADDAIVKAIIELGKSLNLTLIAEGVEEMEQLQLLQELGCHEIQGYYFCRPLPINKLDLFLSEFRTRQAG